MIDQDGFRLNVGIVLMNSDGKLFWGQRIGNRRAWQFPQGGMHKGEEPQQALYRELQEEVGLMPEQVEIVKEIPRWLNYYLPKQFRRYDSKPLCIGQKQRWFLLRLLVDDQAIDLRHSDDPEFEQYRWVDSKTPIKQVILFKREVYKEVLREFKDSIKPC